MDLPAGQDELIEAVRESEPAHGGGVERRRTGDRCRWVEQTPAVMNAWFPGEEGGHAIADMLFGDVNPSGKLPVTFPRRIEDSASWGHYPGKDGVVDYAEGIYVGYRHFDKKNIEPLFCFGHGLSYTKFEYSDLKVSAREVEPERAQHGSPRWRRSGAIVRAPGGAGHRPPAERAEGLSTRRSPARRNIGGNVHAG